MKNKKALLLIGSPKGDKSSSNSIGNYLLNLLKKNDFEIDKIHIHYELRLNDETNRFLWKVYNSDLLIFAFPLYIDSLPAPVIKIMEIIAKNYKKNTPKIKQKILVILNCGFPEASQNEVALEVCKQFASKVQVEYVGGLALGAGGAISGRSLESLGGMVRNVKKSLELAAAALTNNEYIPDKAISLMAKKMMPNWLYTFMGDWGWKVKAKKNGVKNRLYDKPYL